MTEEQEQKPTDIDLDAAFQDGVNEQEVQKTFSDSLLDAGWYRTLPPGTVNKREYEGRITASVFVAVQKDAKKGEEFVPNPEKPDGRIRIEVSPMRANKMLKDAHGQFTIDSGQPDNKSMLWAQLFRAFQVAAGRKPENGAEMLDYLSDQPVKLRVIQVGVQRVDKEGNPVGPAPDGEPKNFVMGIGVVRE